jgi:hypothetical protein
MSIACEVAAKWIVLLNPPGYRSCSIRRPIAMNTGIYLSSNEMLYVIAEPDAEDCEKVIQVTDETLARWKRIGREFDQVQEELARAYDDGVSKVREGDIYA